MADFFLEFEVIGEDAYRRLEAVVAALVVAKRDDDFRDDDYWLAYFDDQARSHFWWPSEVELQEYWQRWYAAPVALRLSDPEFQPKAWDFSSMIDAFKCGDYDLLGCRRLSLQLGRLEFEPYGWPFGGTGCMRALVEAFGHRKVDDAVA